MNNSLSNLEQKRESLSVNELQEAVLSLADEIISTDERLLSITKKWKGYGTWQAVGFANKYHFGEKLAAIIEEATTGRITHDEDHEFDVKEFRDGIYDLIWQEIY